MKKLIFMAVLVLAGCASEGDRAAEAYEGARNAGASDTELCRAAKNVDAQYRARGQASKADEWADTARLDCNRAALTEGYRPY